MKPRLIIRQGKWFGLATRDIFNAQPGQYFVVGSARRLTVADAIRLYRWELS